MMAMRRRGCAAALLALMSPGAAAAQETVLEPTIMIVEFPAGAPMIGFPSRCPDASPDDEEGEWICLAELYQGRAHVVRHLSGPRVRHGEFIRLTAHARRWRPGQRMLVGTVPFRDGGINGQFAWFWRLPESNGDFCVPTGELQRWDEGPLRAAFADGDRTRFRARGYVERLSLRCIGL